MKVYSADWVLPIDGPPIEHGGVAFEHGRIVAVGRVDELEGDVEHFPDAAIIPGLVNAHTHLEYALYAGFGDGLPFLDWLGLHVERKRRLDFDATLAIARAGAADCLASGVTTIGDASFSGASVLAAAELGLRGIVYLEVFGEDAGEIETRFLPNRERVEHAAGDLVRIGVSPHALLTAGAPLFRAALELGLPVSTHLAESDAEREWLVEGLGPIAAFAAHLPSPPGETAIRALAREGLLSPRMCAVHCVVVDPEEIRLLAAHDVAVVHCPRSNAFLGVGVAPLAELRAHGLRVGLGTDSPNSAPSFDMFDEMRAALALARATSRSVTALTPADALFLATLGGAEALGLADEVGSLTVGKRADLAVVSLEATNWLPWEDPVVACVLGGSSEHVSRTIVDGVPRYSKGGSEWHELRRSAAAARRRMLGLEDVNSG